MKQQARSLPFQSLLAESFRAEGRALPPGLLVADVTLEDPTLPDGIVPDAPFFRQADHNAETRPMFVRPVVVGVEIKEIGRASCRERV